MSKVEVVKDCCSRSACVGDLLLVLRGLMPEVRLVTNDGSPAEAYFRIEADGVGVLVVKPLSEPILMDKHTNAGCFTRS
jgi:hypothetical protein